MNLFVKRVIADLSGYSEVVREWNEFLFQHELCPHQKGKFGDRNTHKRGIAM